MGGRGAAERAPFAMALQRRPTGADPSEPPDLAPKEVYGAARKAFEKNLVWNEDRLGWPAAASEAVSQV